MIMEIPSVDTWLSDILSKDPMTFEDAYWGERPPVELAVPEIIRAMDVHFDPYTRGKLIELLGECGNPAVLPILEKELLNSEESMRNWARGSIDALTGQEPWQKNPKYL